jgi:hypothetical protein
MRKIILKLIYHCSFYQILTKNIKTIAVNPQDADASNFSIACEIMVTMAYIMQ